MSPSSVNSPLMRPTPLLSLRRSMRHLPRAVTNRNIPPALFRNITIQASAPDPDSDSTSTNFELVSGHSSHPFASNYSDASSASSSTAQSSGSSSDGGSASTGTPEVIPVVTNLPQPPSSPPTVMPHLQHPFDTHAFVTYLEKSEVKQGTAVVLMESVRDLIIQRKTMALKRMLDKEEMENVSMPVLAIPPFSTFLPDICRVTERYTSVQLADDRPHICSERRYQNSEPNSRSERRATRYLYKK